MTKRTDLTLKNTTERRVTKILTLSTSSFSLSQAYPFFSAFVTFKISIGYKEACKRCPFALQNMPFYTSKDALLHCKRASFTTQKGVDGKQEGKKLTKRSGLPKPSEGGDVRGYGGIWVAH